MKNIEPRRLYKSLRKSLTSEYGNFAWKVGAWYKHDGEVRACKSGFHASKRVIDAMRYVNMEHLALVEVRGRSDLSESDKECWSEMRIVEAWDWTKEDSIALAIYAAELVIEIYEKQYPNGNKPRQAIEAAKNYLAKPTEENRAAADAAADAAAGAAGAAAYAAADAAARAARAAAYAAAGAAAYAAAYAAAGAAAYAAASAADERTLDQCEGWIQERIKTLKSYDPELAA
jgi:hypothetical protein